MRGENEEKGTKTRGWFGSHRTLNDESEQGENEGEGGKYERGSKEAERGRLYLWGSHILSVALH